MPAAAPLPRLPRSQRTSSVTRTPGSRLAPPTSIACVLTTLPATPDTRTLPVRRRLSPCRQRLQLCQQQQLPAHRSIWRGLTTRTMKMGSALSVARMPAAAPLPRLPRSQRTSSVTRTPVSRQATTYQYRVRAYNTAGNSAYSNTASATTTVTLPAAPSALTATAASSTQINLAWTDNSNNEDGFRIERCQDAGCSTFAEIATVAANVVSYQNTGLTAAPPTSIACALTTLPATPDTRTLPVRRRLSPCRQRLQL